MLLRVIETSPQSLIQSADERYRQGEFAESVRLYAKAFSLIEKTREFFPAETFTRLALALHEAGRSDEAWRVFQELLENGCPGRGESDDCPVQQWLDRAIICDKVRLFLQRNGEHDRALLYGIQFYIARWMTCYHERSLGKLGPMRSRAALSGLLRPMLKRAGKEVLEEPLVGELRTFLRRGAVDDLGAFSVRVAMIISAHNLRTNPIAAQA